MEHCVKHNLDYVSHTITLGGQTIQTGCPECSREKVKEYQQETEAELKKYIETIKRNQRYEDLKNKGIEPEFFNATLENYIPESLSEIQALKAVQKLVDGTVKKVLLLGDRGTGKTHLGIAFIKATGGIRLTAFELSARIREGYRNQETETEVMNRILNNRSIFLDEVGRSKASEAELNWLSYFLDKCHTRGIPVLIASNRLPMRALPKDKRDQAIEMFLPDDSISRLGQNSIRVEVKGRDRRMAALQ